MSPVEKSAPKWALMLALGLDDGDRAHQDLYTAMKAEAASAYDTILLAQRGALKPQYAAAPEPWSYAQFQESYLRLATERICSRASARTRPIFAKAAMGGDNWVARWFLYHVCRYRDSRNLRARSTNYHDDDEPPAGSSGPSKGSSSNASSSKAGGKYYDAARNNYRTA